ncbi:MAG: hypothetical protein ACEY3D_02740 [Rickettsia sp.]
MDPVVKPRGDTVGFTVHATIPPRNDDSVFMKQDL